MSRVIAKEEYDDFRSYLEEASGILLGDSKHYLVSSRLNRLMEEYGYSTFADLMVCLRANRKPGLREKVIDAMTTNETMWFRDSYPFELLKSSILPEFSKLRDRPLRIWSAACSTGQEPYSLSIILQEYAMSNPGTFPKGVEIVATDISSRVLDYAKTGSYEESELNRGMSEERKQRYFKKQADDRWQVRPELKSRIQYRLLNLQQNYGILGKFDLIFCRNVLIYFSSELKTDILERMGAALNQEGYLMLGGSETPTRYTSRFSMVRMPQGVVYRRS